MSNCYKKYVEHSLSFMEGLGNFSLMTGVHEELFVHSNAISTILK